jgi:hypothetical protein
MRPTGYHASRRPTGRGSASPLGSRSLSRASARTLDDRLAAAAVEAVRQWRYEPVLDEEGQPKALGFVVTVRFALS